MGVHGVTSCPVAVPKVGCTHLTGMHACFKESFFGIQ